MKHIYIDASREIDSMTLNSKVGMRRIGFTHPIAGVISSIEIDGYIFELKQPNHGLNSPIGQEIIMAKNITVLAAGGTPKVLEVSTVQAAYDALNITGAMTATVNGEPASMTDSLSDFAHVSFAAQVKGGNK